MWENISDWIYLCVTIISNIGHAFGLNCRCYVWKYSQWWWLFCLFLPFCVQKSDNRKAYFMVFERGPRAFIGETVKLLRGRAAQDSSLQNICQSASDYVNERVTVLSFLRCSLAIFLAQVCFTWLFVSLFLSVTCVVIRVTTICLVWSLFIVSCFLRLWSY